MEVKKAIKKVIALGAGATMVGATILGAVATADLANYPAFFVKDGVFNGMVVVGESAQSVDTLAALDIAPNMRYFKAGSESTVTIEGDNVQIEKSGDALNYGDDLADIESAGLDDADLGVLADGTYDESEGETDNDVTYTQKLEFDSTNNANRLVFDDNDDGANLAGSYLHFVNGEYLYTYTLEFDDAVEYDVSDVNNDYEGSVLTILGRDYIVTKAEIASNNQTDKLELLGGSEVISVDEGDPVEVTVGGTDYSISLDTLGTDTDGELVAKFTVNNEVTDNIQEGDTFELEDGTTMGVRDLISQEFAGGKRSAKIFLGADEIILEEGQEVKVNGEDIDSSNVDFSGASGELTQIVVTLEAEDDVYLGSETDGMDWTDPVFGQFGYKFAGVTTSDVEMIDADAGGSSDATFTFVNPDGKTVEVPVYRGETGHLTGTMFFGSDYDEQVFFDNMDEVDCNQASANDDDCEGSFLFVVDSGEASHLIEITDIDTTDNETSLKDVTYGRTFTKDITFNTNATINETNGDADCEGTASSLDLGSAGTINVYFYLGGRLCINDGGIELDGAPETQNEAVLSFLDTRFTGNSSNGVFADGNATVTIRENDDESNNATVNVTFYEDTGDDDRLEIVTPGVTTADYSSGFIDESDDNDDTQYLVTEWGSKLTYDAEEKISFSMAHPASQAEGQFYVTGEGASSSTSEEGDTATVALPTGYSVTDAELMAMGSDAVETNNLIVVGGPCVNDVAAELLDSGSDCAEGFEEGKAMVKLFENGDNVAMLVAGFSGADTRAAGAALAQYDSKYKGKFKGSAVELTTVSGSDVTFTTMN
jgi:hypothetical protein